MNSVTSAEIGRLNTVERDVAPGVFVPGQVDDTQPIYVRYANMLLRRRWWLIGSLFVAVALGLIVTLLTTPQYTASTTIEISRDAQRVVDIKGVDGSSNVGDLEFYQTQYGLLKSRALAEKVASDLRLDQNPQFFSMFNVEEPGSGGGLFKAATPKTTGGSANRAVAIRAAGEVLLDHIVIAPVRLSRLVEISFTSPDPSLSARIANAWTAQFIAANLERRYDATSYARKFLEERLEQLRGRLQESERALVNYASDQQIINIPTSNATRDAPAVERSLVADDLSALNAELASATADMIRARSRLTSANGRGAATEAQANPAIASLRQRRAEIAAEYQRMLVQFEPQYPAAQALASQVAQLDRSIAREESRVSESLAGNYQGAEQRVAELTQRVNVLKSSFIDQRRRSIQYNIYQREADTNRQLYDGLLQRYKEIGVAGGVGTNNVAVVDPADVPTIPSQPRLLLNLIGAILAGLVIGIAIALVLEHGDDTITTPSDVERLLKLPLLGTVPKAKTDVPVVELEDRKSNLVEAYLSVQTNLGFATSHGLPRTISVTSTRPAEGKSTTAYAIALAIARSGKRVLLVDADMRSPSVHHVLSMKNSAGLSNYLAGSDDIDALLRTTPVGELTAMTAGPQPPNAAELLASARMPMLFEKLLIRFDHIVIDSPPVMGLADAPLIASKTEAAIYVVQSHSLRSSLVSVAVNRLRAANANLVGVVLTKFEDTRMFGYHYDYSYSYGDHAAAKV